MATFAIGDAVFERLPDLCVGIVVARGIDNSHEYPEIDRMLDGAVAEATGLLANSKASDDPRVQPYREAFHVLGMSPSRYPSSNIALLRRIAKGKGLWRVNPIVDLGNAISISYGLPLGAHVLKEGGMLELRFSEEGDVFVPLGEERPDATLAPGELVYTEGNLIHTRRWTWRQSENGKVEPTTTEVVFPVDGFVGKNDACVREACDDLATRLREVFGCEATTSLASSERRTV